MFHKDPARRAEIIDLSLLLKALATYNVKQLGQESTEFKGVCNTLPQKSISRRGTEIAG